MPAGNKKKEVKSFPVLPPQWVTTYIRRSYFSVFLEKRGALSHYSAKKSINKAFIHSHLCQPRPRLCSSLASVPYTNSVPWIKWSEMDWKKVPQHNALFRAPDLWKNCVFLLFSDTAQTIPHEVSFPVTCCPFYLVVICLAISPPPSRLCTDQAGSKCSKHFYWLNPQRDG